MDECDKSGIASPTGTVIDGLLDSVIVPIIGAAGGTAYTLNEFFRILKVHWANRGLDPETPIYDQLCREMGPPCSQ